MIPAKLTFAKYSEMDEQQRKDYSESWLYIRNHTSGEVQENTVQVYLKIQCNLKKLLIQLPLFCIKELLYDVISVTAHKF